MRSTWIGVLHAGLQARLPAGLHQQPVERTRPRLVGRNGSTRSAIMIASLLCLSLLPLALPADDLSSLELTDGSVVVGEVLGMSDGVYSVRSPTLGTISIDSSRIRMIRNVDTAATPSTGFANPSMGYGADIEALQQQLIGSPDLMQMIVGLQNDPAVQRAMANPDLMALIASGNIDALRQHPSFLELMSHPGIRSIVEQLQPR